MTDIQRRVVIDGRRYDVAVVSVDDAGALHVAAHVRDSFAQLCASTDGTERGGIRALDLNNVSRSESAIDVYVVARHDVEIVLGPRFPVHSAAAPMIEKLRIAAGLIRS